MIRKSKSDINSEDFKLVSREGPKKKMVSFNENKKFAELMSEHALPSVEEEEHAQHWSRTKNSEPLKVAE